MPTQIGSTFCPSESRSRMMGMLVTGSTISPLIVISICNAFPFYFSRGPNTRSSPLACGAPLPRAARGSQFLAGPQHPLVATRLRGPFAPRRSWLSISRGAPTPASSPLACGPFAPRRSWLLISRGAPTPARRHSLAGPLRPAPLVALNFSRGPNTRSSPLACEAPSPRAARGSQFLAGPDTRSSLRGNAPQLSQR